MTNRHMNNLTLNSAVDEKKPNLTRRFVVTGLVTALVIAIVTAILVYYLVVDKGLNDTALRLLPQIQSEVSEIFAIEASFVDEVVDETATPSSVNDQAISLDLRLADMLARSIEKISEVGDVSIFDLTRKRLFSSDPNLKLSKRERTKLNKFNTDDFSGENGYLVTGPNIWTSAAWRDVTSDSSNSLTALYGLQDRNGDLVGVARVMVDSKRGLSDAFSLGVRLMVYALLGNLLLFWLLYRNFRRGIDTIEDQERVLNHQIARLSSLLSINKNMQKSIKTASARAVELNEQFLRRVGADLHDGPAQMIGYAMLRLNKVSKEEAVKKLGHEFHAVKDALEESLEEIRGISSGLVLPELEQLSLEQCLRKVVLLHSANSAAKISQYYKSLTDEIDLPIKICAYRFVQEGLNNAERHGQAKKCRLTAQMKGDVLHLSLKDNGMGFRKSRLSTEGGHLGLMGLKDRIESLGGKLSINSELGVGTAIKLSIALKDEE